jgi:hypothetical protein
MHSGSVGLLFSPRREAEPIRHVLDQIGGLIVLSKVATG